MSPKNIKKDASCKTEGMTLSANFRNEVRQQKDWQKYKTIEQIVAKCTNIPENSPENLQKIYHTEPDLTQC